MENLVPLGTGNSRLMKSNISPSTTLAQLISMLNNGTFPYDVGTINPAGISQQGTPLNKDTLFSAATQAKYPLTIETPNGALDKLANAVLYFGTQTPKYQEVTVDLSTVQEGDIVQLEENGVLVDFYVAKLNYESTLNGTGRTLVFRKDCYDERQWHISNVNAYASSAIDSWLNSTYKNMLDADIRELIGSTKIRYTPGNGNTTMGTLDRAVFLLSAYELGKSESWFNKEGTTLPNATNYQIAKLNGSTVVQWTRSPRVHSTNDAVYLDSGGHVSYDSCDYSYGSRPAFTLPSTFSATYYVDSSGNLHDEQEYDEAGSTTDVKGNPITIGTQIAIGSYVGTGTYGESNPNTLTFDFEPKLVLIANMHNVASHTIFSLDYEIMVNPIEWMSGGYISSSNSSYNNKVTWSGNEVSWYGTGNFSNMAYLQKNKSGTTYYYIAIA